MVVPGEPIACHETIDRVAPTIRPDRWALMRQDWHHLAFLHWEVSPEQVRRLLPPGLDLDLYEGKAYVGLTPFTMTNVRPTWLPPLPLISHFHETNVRTYVHAGGRDPGVWFFSLDASSAAAVAAARGVLGLPYCHARIEMTVGRAPGGDRPLIDYTLRRRWPGRRPASCRVRYAPRGPVAPARLGSLEYFLVERYVLYTTRGGRLYRGRIHHAPWPLQEADVADLDESLVAAAGISAPDVPPLAHYGREARVEIFGLEQVELGGRSET